MSNLRSGEANGEVPGTYLYGCGEAKLDGTLARRLKSNVLHLRVSSLLPTLATKISASQPRIGQLYPLSAEVKIERATRPSLTSSVSRSGKAFGHQLYWTGMQIVALYVC